MANSFIYFKFPAIIFDFSCYVITQCCEWLTLMSHIKVQANTTTNRQEPLPGGGACSQDPLTFLDFIPCSPLLKPLVPKNDPNNLVKSSPVPWK